MKKHSWLHAVLILAVLTCALLIFFFSSQGGEVSDQTSAGFVNAALAVFRPDYPTLPEEEQLVIYEQFNFIVRKTAHFIEFSLLGFLLRLMLNFHRIKLRGATAWLLGTLYAGTDEWHQFLGGDRTASIRDVCIDSAGVLFGCLLAAYLYIRCAKNKE